MTLNDWLESNEIYSEATAVDRNGNEFIWIENDPRYEAKVLAVVPVTEFAAKIVLNC